MKQQPVGKILKAIEQQTGLSFFYFENTIDTGKKVSINLRNVTLYETLTELSGKLNFSFSVSGKQIILSKKRNTAPITTKRPSTVGIQLSSQVISQSASPQIGGRVTDDQGIALPGVSVFIKGTTFGTSTDADGKYTVNRPTADSIAVFSYIGYITKEIRMGNMKTIDVILKTDITALKEVVVVGYGTSERAELSGAISSVKGKDFEDAPAASFDALLQGRASGVQIVSNSGAPGGAAQIKIRGVTSIGAGNQPLYILDGIPIRAEDFDNNLFEEAVNNPLADINPSDIESIEILKDASATAIYGARAANGVVLVTTKRGGKAGKTSITFSGWRGVQNVPQLIPTLTGDEYQTLMIEREINEPARDKTTETPIPNVPRDPNFNGNTNWQKEIFKPASMQNYDLSIRGGNENTQYSLSMGYLDQQGVLISTGFKRFTTRLNMDHRISRIIKVGNSVSFTRSYTDETRGGLSGNINGAITRAPNQTVYQMDANGNVMPGRWAIGNRLTEAHPVAALLLETSDTFSNRAIGNVYTEITPIKGLMIRSNFSFDYTDKSQRRFSPNEPYVGDPNRLRQTYHNTWNNLQWISEHFANYNITLAKDHRINVVTGISWQSSKNDEMRLSGRGSPSDRLIDMNAVSQADQPYTFRIKDGLASIFGRIDYTFKDRYALSLNIRRDGSSRFGTENKFGTFPAVSGYWRLSSEPYLQSIMQAANISDLKIRASYGITGNQRIPGNRAYSLYTTTGMKYLDQVGIGPYWIASPNLGWEQTAQSNIGIDFAVLQNRITFIADYYVKKTEGLVLDSPLPNITGFTGGFQNFGNTSNRGIELALQAKILTGSFKYDVNMNWSANRNRVDFLPNAELRKTFFVNSPFIGIARQGEQIGALYGYVYEGVYPRDQDAWLTVSGSREDGTPMYAAKYFNPTGEVVFKKNADGTQQLDRFGNPVPQTVNDRSATGTAFKGGDAIFRDTNQDGIISDADMTVIGHAQPKFIGGMNNNFSYKGFTLNLFLQFSYGNQLVNGTRRNLATSTRSVLRRWTNQGDITDIPRVTFQDAVTSNRANSSRWIEDGSYLRVKTVTFGYTVPSKWSKSVLLKNARVYVSAQNLLTFTRYLGYDPEVNAPRDPMLVGFDHSTYPQARTITGGVTLAL